MYFRRGAATAPGPNVREAAGWALSEIAKSCGDRGIYDIIGDVHGQADKLEALLRHIGYRKTAGAWRHRERQVIFVGDFVDRGPKQLCAIDTVRRMIDAGVAPAVMGNHELNAIAWHTPDPRHAGEYLRPHCSAKWGDKNREQHEAFLAEVKGKPALHAEIIDWFLALPLWLELPELRVVHACWHAPLMTYLAPLLQEGHCPQPRVDGPRDGRAGR